MKHSTAGFDWSIAEDTYHKVFSSCDLGLGLCSMHQISLILVYMGDLRNKCSIQQFSQHVQLTSKITASS